jgi:hypothetical protein
MAKADGHEAVACMRLEATALAGRESARSVRADCRPSSLSQLLGRADRGARVRGVAIVGASEREQIEDSRIACVSSHLVAADSIALAKSSTRGSALGGGCSAVRRFEITGVIDSLLTGDGGAERW